jgi:hypothetical protein
MLVLMEGISTTAPAPQGSRASHDLDGERGFAWVMDEAERVTHGRRARRSIARSVPLAGRTVVE